MRAFSLIIKLLILIAVIGVGIIVYTTCSGAPLVQRIDKTFPDVNAAPLEVSTPTHIYYASRANFNQDKSVTMLGWYERLGNKWVLHQDSITLPPVLHPNISKRQ